MHVCNYILQWDQLKCPNYAGCPDFGGGGGVRGSHSEISLYISIEFPYQMKMQYISRITNKQQHTHAQKINSGYSSVVLIISSHSRAEEPNAVQ